MTWKIILLWLFSRFIFNTFDIDLEIYRIIYFFFDNVLKITIFTMLSKSIADKHIRRLINSCIGYCCSWLVFDVLIFSGIGTESNVLFCIVSLIITILSYYYVELIEIFGDIYRRKFLHFYDKFICR